MGAHTGSQGRMGWAIRLLRSPKSNVAVASSYACLGKYHIKKNIMCAFLNTHASELDKLHSRCLAKTRAGKNKIKSYKKIQRSAKKLFHDFETEGKLASQWERGLRMGDKKKSPAKSAAAAV